MALNLPPLELYNCAQFALNDINEFTKGQGYAVSKFRLKTNKQSPPTVCKIWLRCAKGNSFKRTAWNRLTGSHMTGYPFELTLTHTAIRQQVEVQEPNHNHEAFIHAAALLYYHQHTKELKKTIADISASSITPSKILTNLLKKDITISLKDIYNERQANKKQLLGRLSSIQALLKALYKYKGNNLKSKYYFVYKEDNHDYIKYLFFTHLKSLKYFQKNPNILLLNYIYKINKFKMPFLYIVGVTNIGDNFELTYCFLPGKTEGNYNFTIRQIYLLYF